MKSLKSNPMAKLTILASVRTHPVRNHVVTVVMRKGGKQSWDISERTKAAFAFFFHA